MNKTYVLTPLLALSIFSYVYQHADADRVALEAQRETARAAAKKVEDEKQAARLQEAKRQAELRVKERERLAREAAEKKQREQEAIVQRISDEAEKQEAEAARLDREVATLTTGLAQFRQDKETVERAAFALARDVEQKRVERRNAEMEVQRATRMFIARLERL